MMSSWDRRSPSSPRARRPPPAGVPADLEEQGPGLLGDAGGQRVDRRRWAWGNLSGGGGRWVR